MVDTRIGRCEIKLIPTVNDTESDMLLKRSVIRLNFVKGVKQNFWNFLNSSHDFSLPK